MPGLVEKRKFSSSSCILDALKACCRNKDLQKGKQIHETIVRSGNEPDAYIASSLINMYAKCGSILEARRVFDSMRRHDVVSWTAIIMGYADNGQGERALELFLQMEYQGFQADGLTFVAALKACTSLAIVEKGQLVEGKIVMALACEKGMSIHTRVLKTRYCSDLRLVSTLVDFYAKCGCLHDAQMAFQMVKPQSVVSWNALMFGYANHGQGDVALHLYLQMRAGSCTPNFLSYVAALKACSELALREEGIKVDGRLMKVKSRDQGVAIHLDCVASKCSSDIRVETTLVDMYAKCGSFLDAHKVFDAMQHRTVVAWTALLLGYTDAGQHELALELFSHMKREGVVLDAAIYVAVIKTCSSMAAKEEWKQVDGRPLKVSSLERGIAIHDEARRFCSDISLSNTLIDMYVNCGSLEKAKNVFDAMQKPSVVSWNALMFGYADMGEGRLALDLYQRMLRQGFTPNSLTFVAALKACAAIATTETGKQIDGKIVKIKSLEEGSRIHSQLKKDQGCESDVYVASTLIDMYAKCGTMNDACKVFETLKRRTVVSWNAMIFGYADNGEYELALDLHSRMQHGDVAPNALTFVAGFKACTDMASKEDYKEVEGKLLKLSSLEKGVDLHRQATSLGFGSNLHVASTMVDMYAKCGSLQHAREVFDGIVHRSAVLWNSLMFGYVDNGEEKLALELLSRMGDEGCAPDVLSLVASAKACTSLAAKEAAEDIDGKLVKHKSRARALAIHCLILRSNCGLDVRVENALIDMYANCCSMENALEVFDKMQYRDIISWNSLISGYVDNRDGGKALDLFFEMRKGACTPDAISFSAALKACGNIGALDIGKSLLTDVHNNGYYKDDPVLVTSLMDFYIKSGNVADAQEAFNTLTSKDLVAWVTLMGGYSLHGDVQRVLELFQNMKDTGLNPNGPAFLCILTACKHAGLVEKGKEYFEAMSSKYETAPDIEHYTCMIDILGRANELDDAVALLESMPCAPDAVTWLTVLGACVMWKNVRVGRVAFNALMKLNKNDPAPYVMMANIYKSQGMQQDF